MANENENLEFLDLEDDTADLESLPAGDPFPSSSRPKRPWLLFVAALIVIALSVYIIIKVVGTDNDDSVVVNLDEPAQVVAPNPADTAPMIVPPREEPKPVPAPPKMAEPQVAPTRVVEDRKEVTFKPTAPVRAEAARPAPVAKPAAPKAATSAWYVQFGSYGTRAAAETAQKRIRKGHETLFEEKQFVILAAVLPNGKTTYRLRIGFDTNATANGFCQNAKSDGLECYVSR